MYVYGRSRTDPRRKTPGRHGSGHVQLPEQEWTAMIEGALPAYITVERWRANRERMAANASTRFTPGALRSGCGLLAGLVHCGRCHQRMAMMYHSERGWRAAAYACTGGHSTYGEPHRCQTVTAHYVDRQVAAWLLEALAPAGLEVALQAADHLEAERAEEERLWSLRLEHAQYAADRARRRYQAGRAGKPSGRPPVGARLGGRTAHQALVEEHDRFARSRPPRLTPAERDKLIALSRDLPALWHAKTTTNADRKELLRAVIDKVEVAIVGTNEQVDVTVHWAGQQTTTARTVRRVQTLTQLSYYPQLLDHVCQLAADGLTSRQITQHLNADGRFHPTDPDRRFSCNGIYDMLRSRSCLPESAFSRAMNAAAEPLTEHEWRLSDLAQAAGVCRNTIMTQLERGRLTGRQEARAPHRWIIHADPSQLQELRGHSQKPRRRAPSALRAR
ncbi:zinc ribbon domain-containing protein [Streptacidiphilus carbonis]|uniref:zinc ribbon domain-containing protein n=1 Tax=Streptacidiphilus carbonis TaxID=105422 RepID=UPI001F30B00F|nr:zinc ribbon domain-containing protein [Streptacidiphilus carbonis]